MRDVKCERCERERDSERCESELRERIGFSVNLIVIFCLCEQ